jgi:hypothetical protein
MTEKLTDNDLAYLDYLKEKMGSINSLIFIKNDDNTFTWDELLSPKPNCQKEMIEALIKDIKEDTNSYVYQIYMKGIIEEIFQKLFEHQCDLNSNYLKLKMVELIPHKDMFKRILIHSSFTKNSSLMLNILEKGYHYGEVDNFKNHQMLLTVVAAYKELIHEHEVDIKELELNFIQHIKHSSIKIKHVNLIHLFVHIFKNDDIHLLYDAFNIAHGDANLAKVAPKTFSIIELNVNKLMEIQLQLPYITELSDILVKQNTDFPHFYVLNQNEEQIQLAVESGEKNEAKLLMLFNELYVNKYDYALDSLLKYDVILTLMKHINEVVNLDSVVEHGSTQNQKIKI